MRSDSLVNMISIRRYWERSGRSGPPEDLADALTELQRLLREKIGSRRVDKDLATEGFDLLCEEFLGRLDRDDSSPTDVVRIANEAFEALERQCQHNLDCLREQRGQMQSMITMLTSTIADLSGQSQGSVIRLQQLERQIEQASRLEDIRALKANLEECLTVVRQAAAEQRKTASAVERLHEHIVNSRPPAGAMARQQRDGGEAYLAAFKLQRSDSIVHRFGSAAAEHMLSLIGEGLKPLLGPRDRLARGPGFSFVAMLYSAEAMPAIRRRIASLVTKISQRYVEIGENSALLAISMEWVVLATAQYASTEAALAEADSFLGANPPGGSPQQPAPHHAMVMGVKPASGGGTLT